MFFGLSTTQVVLIPVGLFVAATLIEYLCRITEVSFKPTVGLDFIISYLRTFYQKLGEFAARISSFYITLRLQELILSAWDIFIKLCELCLTPIYFIGGYIKISLSYANPILVYVGSATIVSVLLGMMGYYYYENIYGFFEMSYTFLVSTFVAYNFTPKEDLTKWIPVVGLGFMCFVGSCFICCVDLSDSRSEESNNNCDENKCHRKRRYRSISP